MCLVLSLLRPPSAVTDSVLGHPIAVQADVAVAPLKVLPPAALPPQSGGISPAWGLSMLLAFGVFMLLVAAAVERLSPSVLLGEWGLLEILQLVLLSSSALFLFRAAKLEGHGSAMHPLTHLLLIALVRELDGPLDAVWHGFWKLPALGVLALCIQHIVKSPRAILRSLEQHSHAPHAGLFLGASAVVLLQSRLLGRQSLWRSVLGDDYVYVVPRLVEEASELAGYALIFLAAVQVHRWSRSIATEP